MKIDKSTIRTDTALDLGRGYTALVTVEHDQDSGPPWEQADGHGPVSDWQHRDKRAGELILATDGGSRRFYDFAAAVNLARRDGWDTKPYNTGTKGERAHRAAMADYEFLRGWCNNEWQYVGVSVTVTQRGAEIGSDSLWGVESCGDYWRDVAAENIEGVIEAYERKRKAVAVAARRETRERNYWEARDVVTA